MKSVPLPALKKTDVLLRNKVCGICGTDVHIYRGEKGASDTNPPVILGHEYSGEVVQTGDAVSNLKPGDRVTVDPNIYCEECRYCRNGEKQLCQNLKAIGVNLNGGFAEYSVVPAAQCLKISPKLSYEAAAMSEPLACCIHGIDRAEIRPGMSVCVIGGGPIGLLMVQLARLSGAAQVILSEPVQMRRELGLRLGADIAIDPNAGAIHEQLMEKLGITGADVVIECVGNPKAAEQAILAADKGATVVLFGVPSPGAVFTLPLFQAFRKELTIKTSFVNPDTHQRAVELLNSGRIRTEELITHRFPVECLENAIRKQTEPDSVKVMVVLDSEEQDSPTVQ